MIVEFLFALAIVVFALSVICCLIGGLFKIDWLLLIGILLGISATLFFLSAIGKGIEQWTNQTQIVLSLLKIPM